MSLVPYVQLPSNASTNNENRVVVHPNHGGGAIVPFEISTSAGVTSEGQVVFLRDIELFLNPESAITCEGYVLNL